MKNYNWFKMRKLFWMFVFIFGYLWVVSTGREDLVVAIGKTLYERVADWFKDADVDFQLHKKVEKKKSRRWD